MTGTDSATERETSEREITASIAGLRDSLTSGLAFLDPESMADFQKQLMRLFSSLSVGSKTSLAPDSTESPPETSNPDAEEVLLKIFLSLANLQQDILQNADKIQPEDMRNIRERTEQFLVFLSDNEREIKPETQDTNA